MSHPSSRTNRNPQAASVGRGSAVEAAYPSSTGHEASPAMGRTQSARPLGQRLLPRRAVGHEPPMEDAAAPSTPATNDPRDGEDDDEEEDRKAHTPLCIPPPGMPMPSMEDVQMKEILEPSQSDVLCGRGGGTNNHLGNEKFRVLVNSQKVLYLHSSKKDKPFVSRVIVRAVRAQDPPGRFLQKDESTGFYYDIGDAKAREKTSQALREGAPVIRNQINSNDSTVHDAMAHAVSVNPFFVPSVKLGSGKRGRPTMHVGPIKPPTVPPPPPKARFHGGSFAYSHGPGMGGPVGGPPTPNGSPEHGRLGAGPGGMPFGSPQSHDSAMHGRIMSEPNIGSPYGRFGREGPMTTHSMGPGMRSMPTPPHAYPYPHETAAAPMGETPYMGRKPNARTYRLDFAEVVGQCVSAGTAQEDLLAMDRRVSLYLDAGILGISPDEIVARLTKGETEFDIIEQKYLELKAGRDAAAAQSAKKRKRDESTSPGTTSKSVDHKQIMFTQKDISEALIMVRGV